MLNFVILYIFNDIFQLFNIWMYLVKYSQLQEDHLFHCQGVYLVWILFKPKLRTRISRRKGLGLSCYALFDFDVGTLNNSRLRHQFYCVKLKSSILFLFQLLLQSSSCSCSSSRSSSCSSSFASSTSCSSSCSSSCFNCTSHFRPRSSSFHLTLDY